MGESIGVEIGFVTPRSWWIEREGADWTPPWFVADMAAHIGSYIDPDPGLAPEGGVSVMLYGEGNYGTSDGNIEAILDWCRERRIPYYAASDPKYEYEGDWEQYDPANEITYSGTKGAEAAVLTKGEWESIRDGKHPWAQTVDDYFTGAPNWWEMSVAHLPADIDAVDNEEEDPNGLQG